MASKFDSPQKADRQRRSNRCDFTRNPGTPPLIFTHSACSARFRTKPVPMAFPRQFSGLAVVFPKYTVYFTDLPELIGLLKLQPEIASAVAGGSAK
jgi:hypothetical protein